MNKFWITFMQTFLGKVTSKSFIATTLITILLIVAASNANKIIELFQGEDDTVKEVHLVGDQNKLQPVEAQLKETMKDYDVLLHDEAPKDAEGIVVNIGDDLNEVTATAKEEIGEPEKQSINGAITTLKQGEVMQQLELSPDDMKKLSEVPEVKFEVESDGEDGPKEGFENFDEMNILNYIIVYGGIILMFFIIINYSSQIGMEIATEKSSRVIEMIVSSIKPVHHVMAKVFAMISVSLLQVIILAATSYICMQVFDISEFTKEIGLEPNEQTTPLVIYTIIFTVLGLVFYLSVAALLGSFVNRMEDFQQAFMPLTFALLIGFYIAIFNTASPSSKIVEIASYFPPFTPLLMPLRFTSSVTPDYMIWIGIALMVISCIIIVWFTGRVYKKSVLSTESSLWKFFKKKKKA